MRLSFAEFLGITQSQTNQEESSSRLGFLGLDARAELLPGCACALYTGAFELLDLAHPARHDITCSPEGFTVRGHELLDVE